MNPPVPATRLIVYSGGARGEWRVLSVRPVRGASLPEVARLAVTSPPVEPSPQSVWSLRGALSNVRYITRPEQTELQTRQPPLNRPEANRAALIPIRKSHQWWEMTQEERREVFEEKSHHVRDSMKYLPAVARRLVHSRDLGEPFDFLTWFEYAQEDAEVFEQLVMHLRRTAEWEYVEREVDIRLARE